jgi:hypothetical protein
MPSGKGFEGCYEGFAWQSELVEHKPGTQTIPKWYQSDITMIS